MTNEDLKFIQIIFSRRIVMNINGLPFVIRSIDYKRVPKFGDLSPVFTSEGAEIPRRAEFDLDTVVTLHLETIFYVGGPNKRASMTIDGDADFVAGFLKQYAKIA